MTMLGDWFGTSLTSADKTLLLPGHDSYYDENNRIN
jgi:hypothetical protein